MRQHREPAALPRRRPLARDLGAHRAGRHARPPASPVPDRGAGAGGGRRRRRHPGRVSGGPPPDPDRSARGAAHRQRHHRRQRPLLRGGRHPRHRAPVRAGSGAAGVQARPPRLAQGCRARLGWSASSPHAARPGDRGGRARDLAACARPAQREQPPGPAAPGSRLRHLRRPHLPAQPARDQVPRRSAAAPVLRAAHERAARAPGCRGRVGGADAPARGLQLLARPGGRRYPARGSRPAPVGRLHADRGSVLRDARRRGASRANPRTRRPRRERQRGRGHQSFVERYWPHGDDPLGRRLRFGWELPKNERAAAVAHHRRRGRPTFATRASKVRRGRRCTSLTPTHPVAA